ncbi:hypothetical protein E4U48_001549, partial [Claviceps purpurea]
CKTVDGYVLDGETWENDCIYFGVQKGYYPIGTDGRPDTSKKMLTVGAATGSCPNRG